MLWDPVKFFFFLWEAVMIRKPQKVSRTVAFSQLSEVQRTNHGLREMLSLSITDNGYQNLLKINKC